MGVHYVNGALVGDGKVSAATPELVVYEPLKNGGQRLVAAEYVVFQADWDAKHDEPPSLFGREFELVRHRRARLSRPRGRAEARPRQGG